MNRGNTQPSARNILRVFRQATPDDVSAGRRWYADARDEARALACILFHTDAPTPDQVAVTAAVIAVLSQSTGWQLNLRNARTACELAADGASFDEVVDGLSSVMFGNMRRKAAAIVLGADPASVVSGPKVTPFWQRIVDAASGATGPGSVVIDRHAHDIALYRVTDGPTRGASLGSLARRSAFQMAYVRAAAQLRRTGEAPGITPAELQAVTWIVWRREHAHSQARAQARADHLSKSARKVA